VRSSIPPVTFMTAHSVPGLSVAVARDGELLYERGFGVANRDKDEKVTPAHMFRIASVSKPITSVTLFRLRKRIGSHWRIPSSVRAVFYRMTSASRLTSSGLRRSASNIC
jgi:hypothetical protein